MPISQKTDKINIPWVLLTTTMLITLHLRIFKVSTFDVALGLLLIPFWLVATFKIFPFRFNFSGLALFLISAVIPFVAFEYVRDFQEFINSYFLFILSLFLVFFLWYRKQLTINARSVNIAIIVFQILLVSVCFAQYISFSFFNNISLYNIWGEAQLYYQLRPFSRMKGFYLEPSYLGFVTLAVFWLKLSLDKKPQIFNVFITFFILFTAKSGFAFLGVSLLLFHWYFLNMNRYIKIITLCFIAISAKSLNNSDTFKDVTRLNEISTEKYTSGYVRNILPISIIAELWEENHLLGIKFGQAEHVIKRVILFDVREGEINNSFYAIIIYFGVFGMALYLFLLIKYSISTDKLQKSFIVLFFILLQNSGALLAPQTLLVAIFLPSIALKRNLIYAKQYD